ncbi:hypothetical protein Moror_16182 [Moniliophthora roreri MCA 2997]|uniref:Uncharacterized protein n=2 Tax=Moniliophthora roreri TaxID=221103 RepID=V2X6L6_MONRO|nr:hypothetical protein Moror_16182 [Moniliophthora roreri MCA 2997]KAI3614959.1 hypothetical protein WG66_016825 [Moniliophthora roreri]
MKSRKTRQLKPSSSPEDSQQPRHHPYRRPVHLNEEDTAYKPRIDDHRLLYMEQDNDIKRRKNEPVPAVRNEKEEKGTEEDVDEVNQKNGLVEGTILFLDFLVALFFFISQVCFMGILFRRGQSDSSE